MDRLCGVREGGSAVGTERGFFVKELYVGWKEWTCNRHPTNPGKAEVHGIRCSCSQ